MHYHSTEGTHCSAEGPEACNIDCTIRKGIKLGEKLTAMKLPRLEGIRKRGDMITTHKFLVDLIEQIPNNSSKLEMTSRQENTVKN